MPARPKSPADERPAKKVKTLLKTRPLMTKYLVGLFLANSKNMPKEKFDKLMEEKLIDCTYDARTL